MLNNQTEIDLFQSAIQKLTFSYSIPLSTLCEYTYRCEVGANYYYDVLCKDEDARNELYIMSFRRYGRILERLTPETYSNKGAAYLVGKPKAYDDFLFECQKETYNLIAPLVGYQPIERVLPLSLIKDAAYLDGAQPDLDIITKYYPYYTSGKRDGVNFIEFIMLLSMSLSLRKRSLYTLNKPLSSSDDKKRAKKMVDTLTASINDPNMFPTYLDAFFDVLEPVVQKVHNEKAETYIRTAWLPERLKNRKDAFRAFETHQKEKTKISLDKYEESQMRNIMNSGNAYEYMQMFNSMDNYQCAECIGNVIYIAANMVLGNEIDPDLGISDQWMALAEDYAKIIKTYIAEAIKCVTSILNKLYIE